MRTLKKFLLIGLFIGDVAGCASEAPVGIEAECEGSCQGKTCGDDGCGNSCGFCEAGIGCVDNLCLDRSICSDGEKNGEESDVDCGGRVCDRCTVGKTCRLPTDCATGHCENYICQELPTCSDNRKNADETDVDCGGLECEPCGAGGSCIKASDCASDICTSGECRDPTCNDGLQNQGESDIDCGGPICAGCGLTKTCNDGSDCASGTCEGFVCVPAASCLDNKKNGDESDVDCGGSSCDACATGRACNGSADCLSEICTHGLCRDPSCTDGLKNQNETDVDCGGICDAKCAVNEGCRVNGDCDSNVCDGGICLNVGCNGVPADGRCLNESTVEYCALSPVTGTSYVRTLACEDNSACQAASGGAQCVVPSNTCREGATSCLGSGSLRTCVNGSWASEPCSAGCSDSNPFEAFCKPSEPSVSFNGALLYDVRGPNSARTDWGATTQEPGRGFLVVSMAAQSGSSEPKVFDAAFTNGSDGRFKVNVPLNPGVDDRIVVYAVGAGTNLAHRYAVADPGFAEGGERGIGALGEEQSVWNWSWRLNDIPANKTLVISEEEGSGAARVFEKLHLAFAMAELFYPNQTGRSILAWVGFDSDWECESCFAPWPQALSKDAYGSQLWVSAGADENYWADSKTFHELGHWVMSSYGTPPDEIGPQQQGVPTFAGQAWAEGFATWFSSVMRNDPVGVSKKDGHMSWFDISTRTYSDGSSWYQATQGGGLLQKMDSNEVAAMLWSMGSANTLTLLKAIALPRMNNSPWYRGNTRHEWSMTESGAHTNVADTGVSVPSLPDFFDTLICSGFSEAAIDAVTDSGASYPYSTDNRAMCDGGCNTGNCTRCCKDNVCQPGIELSACGVGGNTCNTCNNNQACSAGSCICTTASCPSGCCSGNTCMPGTSNSYCGTSGYSCGSCGSGTTCESKTCKGLAGTACSGNQDCASGVTCDMVTAPFTCRQICSSNSSCPGGFNCVSSGSYNACVPVPAPNSQWKIRFDQASVRKYHFDDRHWDRVIAKKNRPPDPFVCISFAAVSGQFCSTIKDDTFDPVWNETVTSRTFDYSMLKNATIVMEDDDVGGNDLMLTATGDLRPKRPGKSTTFSMSNGSEQADTGVRLLEITIIPHN